MLRLYYGYIFYFFDTQIHEATCVLSFRVYFNLTTREKNNRVSFTTNIALYCYGINMCNTACEFRQKHGTIIIKTAARRLRYGGPARRRRRRRWRYGSYGRKFPPRTFYEWRYPITVNFNGFQGEGGFQLGLASLSRRLLQGVLVYTWQSSHAFVQTVRR